MSGAGGSGGGGWERVRACGLGLPGAEDGTSYGTSALKVRGRLFARLHEDGLHAVLFVDPGERLALVEGDPDTFLVTPHYERWPMVLVRLDRVDPVELGELVEDSWRRRAPGRLVAARDAQGGAPRGAQGGAGPGGDMGSAGDAPGGAGPGPGPG